MNNKDFTVGKNYLYSQIPKKSTKKITVTEHGEEYLGQHAIHARFHKKGIEVDVWFVWHSQGNEGIFKCVYNN